MALLLSELEVMWKKIHLGMVTQLLTFVGDKEYDLRKELACLMAYEEEDIDFMKLRGSIGEEMYHGIRSENPLLFSGAYVDGDFKFMLSISLSSMGEIKAWFWEHVDGCEGSCDWHGCYYNHPTPREHVDGCEGSCEWHGCTTAPRKRL